jgi:hypothetical protein
MVETELLISICKPETKTLREQFAECTARMVTYAGFTFTPIRLEEDPAYRAMQAVGYALAKYPLL